jgi:serine protease Do
MRSTIKRSLIAATGVAALAGAGIMAHHAAPSMAVAQPAQAEPVAMQVMHSEALADVAERVLGSVVNISTTSTVASGSGVYLFDPFFNDPQSPFEGIKPGEREVKSLGSGVIVNAQGRVLTNSHVVKNATNIKVVLSDGNEYDAKVVGTDPKSDLAVVQMVGDLPALTPIQWGDSNELRVAEMVLAVGNPFGVGQAVTMGIVSAKGRANMRIVEYEDFIQTDAAINPGNSGGALVDMDGKLVGINTAILSRTGGYQGIGFAIPSNMARPIMDALVEHGKVSRGWLGVSIATITPELAEERKLSTTHGVLVDELLADGPAAKAGLAKNDVIVAVDGVSTLTAGELRNAIASAGARKRVTIGYLRDGVRDNATVTLGELPDEPPALDGGDSNGNGMKQRRRP